MGFAANDVNLYRFVTNNPANLTDPSGLAPVDPGKPTVPNPPQYGQKPAPMTAGGEPLDPAGRPPRTRFENLKPGDNVGGTRVLTESEGARNHFRVITTWQQLIDFWNERGKNHPKGIKYIIKEDNTVVVFDPTNEGKEKVNHSMATAFSKDGCDPTKVGKPIRAGGWIRIQGGKIFIDQHTEHYGIYNAREDEWVIAANHALRIITGLPGGGTAVYEWIISRNDVGG